jgi:D-alanine transaminase
MRGLVFLNGDFVEAKDAKVSIFDTGFYYGDGIYEVTLLRNGRIIDLDQHIGRMNVCLDKIRIKTNINWHNVIYDLIKKNNNAQNAIICMQVTRGIKENRYSPLLSMSNPTCIAYIVPLEDEYFRTNEMKNISCLLQYDPRRYRRDIKTISLLPTILSRIEAEEAGVDYIIYKDRISKAITECISSNLFIVRQDGVVMTHPVTHELLPGTVRARTIEILKENNIPILEEKFYEDDLLLAKEIFVTGSIKLYVNVTKIDDKNVGSEKHGEILSLCRKKYNELISNSPVV